MRTTSNSRVSGEGTLLVSGGVTRRALTRGAAWTAPLVSVGAAAPAFAASQCTGSPTTSTFSPGTYTIAVAPGCRTVIFTVIGGTGAGFNGGGGANLQGTITLPSSASSTTLTLVVGQGGFNTGSTGTSVGGVGYGDGGGGVLGATTGGTHGGGGGGSAILLGAATPANAGNANVPLVVAGGGGGASGANSNGVGFQIVYADINGGYGGTAADGTVGGNIYKGADALSTDAVPVHFGKSRVSQDDVTGATRKIAVNGYFGGGYGAAGATGGVKAGAPYFEYGAAAGYSQAANTSVVGNPNAFDGGAHGSGNWGGGNGGAGAGGSSPVSSTGGFANASGSGGGGWAGGGGGTGHYISCWAVAGVTALRQDGGAGGGGSSYFGGGGGATVTMSSSSRQALNPPGNGAGGQIIVTYTPA